MKKDKSIWDNIAEDMIIFAVLLLIVYLIMGFFSEVKDIFVNKRWDKLIIYSISLIVSYFLFF